MLEQNGKSESKYIKTCHMWAIINLLGLVLVSYNTYYLGTQTDEPRDLFYLWIAAFFMGIIYSLIYLTMSLDQRTNAILDAVRIFMFVLHSLSFTYGTAIVIIWASNGTWARNSILVNATMIYCYSFSIVMFIVGFVIRIKEQIKAHRANYPKNQNTNS